MTGTMDRPRIFLGSSGKQQRLLKSLTSGLASVADVEPWTTVFNPGVNTLDRLVELTREVDFAAFVFAQDDWTSPTPGDPGTAIAGMAAPRDNVVFEAGLFGGALGMRRTFILHANGAKLPTDLLGLTCVRYPDTLAPHELKVVNQKVRDAMAVEGRLARVEGDWWQYSLSARSEVEPSAVSLLRISRDRAGGLEVNGRSWQEDGTLSARYWSEATRERTDPAGVFYFHRGERPRHADAPRFEGTGEIKLESADRAAGYYTIRIDGQEQLPVRTSGVYVRADAADWAVLESGTVDERRGLIARRLQDWDAQANS
jgi:Predicted nucleotide-binding protein containing TIR-like domain